jgi:hypothetical protein
VNRIRCSDCSEVALASPEPAERLEGLGLHCTHCGAFGRIVVREDDEGRLAALELITIVPESTP